MKKSFLLSVIFALALVDSALAGATYRLAIRDDAGHLLGTDPSVCYRYKVYNETRGEYTHDKDTTFAVSLIDGGTHNIEFTVETSVWQTGYPCDTNDVLRVEILNANEGNFPIGTITGLAPVGDFVTPILTPTIRATPTPTNPEGEEVDLIRLLADEDSYVNYSMYCAGVESYFGGGWKDDQDRDGDGLSDGLERMLGTDPYGGALSKEEVRQALKAAHFPDLARPNGFESDLTLTENGLVLAAFTHSVGHAYGLRWLRDFSDEGVCLELCDENRKLLGKKAQAVEVKEGMTATDQVIFGLLNDEQMASGCVALTVDGYIVETVELNVGPYDPVGVHVNGVDVGRGRGWGWTYTNEVLTLSGRYAYSLAGTNRTNDVRIEVKNPLSLTFNRLELTSSAAPITVGESAHLTIAGGSAKFVGGDVVSPVPVIVEGGSVSASLTDARSPEGRKLWRVKVPDVSEEGLLEFTGLPVDYRTNDIYALDGELSLWLPNGIYRFTVNGKRYYAAVADAEVTAIDYWPMFMYVDGRDIGCGIGEGWAYSEEFKTLAFTNCTSATLSGTNETSSVKVVTREDLELFFDRVKLVNEENVFATYDDAKLTLAGGTATLIGGSEGVSSDSIVVAGGSFFADLTNAVAPDGKKVWCVKVSGLEAEGALALSGLPSYYRTDGIYAEDGKIALWLPDGIYRFTIDGVSYLAKVNGADVEAFKGDFIGLTVNGLDVAFGRDAGWEIKDDVIKLTGEGPFVLSGADAAGRIGVVADTDTTVTFENLTLSSEKTPFEIAVNRSVRLLLKGDNRLTAKGDTCAALHPNMGSSLVIDRAEGLTDAEAKLIASGAKLGAGIGCGKWQLLGDIEIKGGTIEAIGGENGAGIGGGDGGGAGNEESDPKRAKLTISGGVVTAQGGVDAAGIGCGMRSWGPQIVITGGRIKARGGKNSYSDIGSTFIVEGDITKSFTTINISGGTVDAARIGSTVESQSKAQNTITGGNIIANTVAPDPTNGTNSVYSVTITGLVGDEAIVFEGLPAGYGTNDIYAVDGKAMLWLPNGIYRFTAGGKRYYAEVADAEVTALDYWPMFMYVDGRDLGQGFGEGWAYSEEFGTLAFTNATSAVLSGTNETGAVRIITREDIELFFDRVKLVNENHVLAAYDDAKLTLAGGTATLIGGSEGVVVSNRPIVVAGGSFFADLTNGVAPSGSKAWCVTVSGLETEGPLEIAGLPAYYRTDGIYAVDGRVCLWLPDGAYGFSVNGVSYLARVKGADTDAVKGSLVGLTVNGVDVAFGSDEGWSLANDVLNLTGEGPFVLSGTDAAGQISVLVDTDATVTFDNLSLACKATPFTVATNRVVTLLLKGDNGLTAKGDGRAAVHAYETSSLVIDRAEGCTDAEAQLVALGATGGAGIGCGRNEMMGDIEIKGGTIEATGRNRGAGIGAGEGGGAGGVGKDPRRAKIVISGGVVTAQGGDWAAGIGAGYQSWGPRIEIAGGQVKATGGMSASSDIGSAIQPNSRSYTTIAISGGTVVAKRLGWSGYDPQTKAQVTITGGSVLANAVAPDPTNGVATVYRVTVEGLTGEAAVTLGGLPAGYGTHDIFAVDGKVCLWLPDGRYVFSVDGVPYLAKVAGGDTTAKVLNLTAVIRMGEDGHAVVEPSESVEGCAYFVKAAETLDFADCTIVPVGRIEDLRYHFFRVIVLAVCE